jgi:hypothetical protein
VVIMCCGHEDAMHTLKKRWRFKATSDTAPGQELAEGENRESNAQNAHMHGAPNLSTPSRSDGASYRRRKVAP